MTGVFISHASADKPFVDPFVDYIIRLGCEVERDAIFYSSGEDTGIPSGRNLNEYVRSEIAGVSLVVAIVSPTFQTRPFCVAELGAAWSHVGKLFPIAAPGLERTEMEGVLTGLVVKYLNDSAALDELHDVVCEIMNKYPTAATWGRYKATWLAKVDEYCSLAPTPRIVSPKDYDRMLTDLQGSRDALREAEALIAQKEAQIELLALARSAGEVAEILLPDDERERFEVLCRTAKEALGELQPIVREAVWFELSEGEMPWASPFDGDRRSDIEEASRAGWLQENTDEGVRPNKDFDEVREASDAVGQLDSFLIEQAYNESFKEWFRQKYHLPADIRLKRVWDGLL